MHEAILPRGDEYRDRVQHETTEAPPRPSRWRVAVVGVVVALGAGHLLAVTATAVPPNTYSDAVRPATSYLGAYFSQNWRLFAPNPISSDRVVRFQGAYEEDGRLQVTPWLDWTDVELDLVRHRLVGGRAGYVTNKLYGPLVSRYATLDEAQRTTADVLEPGDALPWQQLDRELRTGSDDPLVGARVTLYLAYDRATTRLATDALEAASPGRRLVAVRYATRSQDVTPWPARGGTAAERQAARPTPVQRINGWRTPLRGDATERAVVADFLRRHR